jgi:uncharacterized protein YlaI
MKLDLSIDLDPTTLAKDLRNLSVKDRRDFVERFICDLDMDSYDVVQKFIADNPVEMQDCPRCKMRIPLKSKYHTQCEYCRAVLP